MPRADAAVLVLALVLALAAPADAGTPVAAADTNAQPVDIQADFGEIDRAAGKGVYRGNVVIRQGGMRITAAEVRIVLVADELERVEIDGGPATFEHLPAGALAPTRGLARNMLYLVKQSLVELKGGARVEQRGDEVAGETIRYDLERDRVLAASGQGSNDRVQMTITPRRSKAPAPAPATRRP